VASDVGIWVARDVDVFIATGEQDSASDRADGEKRNSRLLKPLRKHLHVLQNVGKYVFSLSNPGYLQELRG
jgi:hypothetical protein